MRLKFGSCLFDSATHELLRDGSPVALSPKAFELLTTLLTHRPRALSKSELHAAVWPDTFVSDSSLARLVSELRTALGDGKLRLIRTLHGFGYAFSGEATEVPTPAAQAPPICWLTWGRRVFPLRVGQNLIGRDPDATVVVDSTRVSRRHSRIQVAADKATLEDLGSKNGTYLDGARLERPAILKNGDQLTIGAVVMTFRTDPHGLTTETELSVIARDP